MKVMYKNKSITIQCFACHCQPNWKDPTAPIIEGTYGSGETVLLKC
jgi:hypothetical protein